jgi:predicted RNA-binding protein YlqC (UPF0109 family)
MEKDLVEYIAKSLVDQPEEVRITESDGDMVNVLELRTATPDIGKIIGKNGRMAKSIRTLMSASVHPTGEGYSLEIMD